MSTYEKELRARLLKPLDDIRNQNKMNESVSSEQSGEGVSLVKFISNPTGKGSAYVANRAAIKQGLNITYIKLLRQFRRNFYAVPYLYPNGDILYWVKVPSENYRNNKIAYDVCFLLKYDKQKRRPNRDMLVYSNSPSFIYTYCYVFNKNNMIIDKLKSRLPDEALNKAPVVRNPIQSFGYEKSLYIAARYLMDGGCLNDNYINLYSKMMNQMLEQDVIRKIADPELLVAVYQHAQYQQRKTHRKELSDEERKKRNAQNRKYAKDQYDNRPKSGFIIHHAPRGKITARKAQKSLLNEGSTPSRVIRPHK